jgi:hypothetical protein
VRGGDSRCEPGVEAHAGRLLPFGVLHFLRRHAIIDQARVLLLGVVRTCAGWACIHC